MAKKFNQTTHLQYQIGKAGPWVGFNWRYDSGLIAGAVPFATDTTTPVDLTGFSADQQFQAGLFCGNARATLTGRLTNCAPSQFGSTLVSIPNPGTENDDKNPPPIAARSLFDLSLGDDNLFRGDKTDQHQQSLRTLQFFIDPQRNALRDAAGIHPPARLSFLAGSLWNRVSERKCWRCMRCVYGRTLRCTNS